MIAGGHPYYGRMAAALAASIKAADASLDITLAWAGRAVDHLTPGERALFTLQEIPAEYYTTPGGPKWLRAKMNMYNLSPYSETLFLDCDLIWLKHSPARIFEEVKGAWVSFANFGKSATMWATPEQIVAAYGPGEYYNVHSEIIYFKKGSKSKKWFDTALAIHDNLKISHVQFAGAIPDELPFSIAAALTKTYPHAAPWRPIYWSKAHPGHLHIYQIAESYQAVSMAGIRMTNFDIDTYNTLAAAAYHKVGLQNPYKWKLKNHFLLERKNL